MRAKPDMGQRCVSVYGEPVTLALPGVTAASKTPRKNRTATAPAKFCTAAKHESVAPHINTLNAEYLPMGRRCRSRLVGYL